MAEVWSMTSASLERVQAAKKKIRMVEIINLIKLFDSAAKINHFSGNSINLNTNTCFSSCNFSVSNWLLKRNPTHYK